MRNFDIFIYTSHVYTISFEFGDTRRSWKRILSFRLYARIDLSNGYRVQHVLDFHRVPAIDIIIVAILSPRSKSIAGREIFPFVG